MNAKKSQFLDQEGYTQLLEQLKRDIQQTQLKVALSVTKELILLYWRIGKMISEKIYLEGWGAKTVDRLAHDLASSFPGISGFSSRNLRYMRKFAQMYPTANFAATAAIIPWGHLMVIMDKLKSAERGLWYIHKTLENNWSRSILAMWIESDLYARQGKATTNFQATLPKPQSDLAEQTLKDPYCFDFLTIDQDAREKAIEQGLIDHIQHFLIELGQGFAFVGRQFHLEVGKKDYYIDLLFYHLKLRCYVVVELKAREFDLKDTAQINFYLSAVDSLLKNGDDKPTIGLLLVKEKDAFTAEYALRDINKPIGVAEYTTKLVESLPKNLKSSLPTVEEIEAELEKRHTIIEEKPHSKKLYLRS
jgi:predicted nuclease of restriction endonuclease-like (RecB) superfamily